MEMEDSMNSAMKVQMEEPQQHWNGATESLLATHYPVHRACRNGDIETLNRLLSEQSAMQCLSEDSFYGWTPVHWAAYFGKLTCLQRMLEHCVSCWDDGRMDGDLRTSQLRQTPVHLAAFGGSVGCLRFLLESGCSPAAKDYLGETAAHKAARSGSFECLSLLLTHGVNLTEENLAGQTAAALAAQSGHATTVDFLRRSAELQDKSPLLPSIRRSPPSSSQRCSSSTSMVNGAYGYIPAQFEQPKSRDGTIFQFGDPSVQDVTLDADIGANRVCVAGRKRTRDSAEVECQSNDFSAKKCRLNAFTTSNGGGVAFFSCQM